MFRVSNFVVGLINGLFMILGLAATSYSVYLFIFNDGTECQRFIQTPLLITGVFLFVVSLLGVIGSCCKNNVIMVVYLVVMFLLIVGLIGFTVFAYLVTNEGAGKVVSDKGIREYKTMDFSHWLQKHFVNGNNNWEKIRACLVDSNVCNINAASSTEYYKNNLSPLQSGCCKPPSECGFEFKNATWWEAPKTGGGAAATKDKDCETWSNVQNELCYSCNSCKGGFLANARKEWRHLAISNIALVLLLIILYSLGCCAKNNNRKDRHFNV